MTATADTRADKYGPHRRAYSPAEVADILGMTYKRALRLIKDERIKAGRDGQQYVVSAKALDDYLASIS